MEKISGILKISPLIATLSLFPIEAYTQNNPNLESLRGNSEKNIRLTPEQRRSLEETVRKLNEGLKGEFSSKENSNRISSIIDVGKNNFQYQPEEIKLLYSGTSEINEERSAKWYAGTELTRKREIKNIRMGAEVGGFGASAFVDVLNNKRVVNIKNNIGKNSIELIAGNKHLMQGKASINIPEIANVNLFYDFNTNSFNYVVSKNSGNFDFNLLQQFRNDFVLTSGSFVYQFSNSILPNRIFVNYSASSRSGKPLDEKLSAGFQEKIGILNIEGRLDSNEILGIVPSIRGTINHSWN